MVKLNPWQQLTQQHSLARAVVTAVLLIMLVMGVVLNTTGQRSWQEPPAVPNLGALRALRNTGLAVTGWASNDQAKLRVGSHEWSVQTLDAPGQRVALLMVLPQTGPKEAPGVEWSDVDGFFQWQAEPVRSLTFSTDEGAIVQARVFIARDTENTRVVASRQTVAVAQWYAFNHGGHASSSHWFWRDQWAQLRQTRVPWVAVSLRLPVDPRSTLDTVEPQIIQLSQAIQTSMMAVMNAPPD